MWTIWFGIESLDATQGKIPVLRALEPLSETTHHANQVGLVYGQVTDHVSRKEEIVIPIALEVRIEAPPRLRYLVFVRIN